MPAASTCRQAGQGNNKVRAPPADGTSAARKRGINGSLRRTHTRLAPVGVGVATLHAVTCSTLHTYASVEGPYAIHSTFKHS